jgi:hypothetical protein
MPTDTPAFAGAGVPMAVPAIIRAPSASFPECFIVPDPFSNGPLRSRRRLLLVSSEPAVNAGSRKLQAGVNESD